MTFELTKEYVEHIQAAIDARDDKTLRDEIEPLYPADISGILYELDTEMARYLLALLDKKVGAEILSNLEVIDRREFLQSFTSHELAQYVDEMDSDDAVDLLNEQPIQTREEVIALLSDREQARFILDLLHYDEDVAGGLMQKELIKININLTVNQCIEEIRQQAENVENVHSVYVIDDADKLLGRVSLKKIVLANKNARIADIYVSDLIFVETYRPVQEVAELMQRYDLEAVPVVNVQGRLLGQITIDDVVDVITEQAELDIQAITGITGDVEEEDDTVWKLVGARLPWLIAGAVGSLMAATVINTFNDQLSKIAALAAFIPIIGSTGGNVGIQTASLIVQSLAEKSGIAATVGQRLAKMVLVALINGLIIGSLAGSYCLLIGETRLVPVVSLALLAVVLLASFMGTITPIVLNRFGINPAIASGPFITTVNDLIGIGVYFLIASLLLSI